MITRWIDVERFISVYLSTVGASPLGQAAPNESSTRRTHCCQMSSSLFTVIKVVVTA